MIFFHWTTALVGRRGERGYWQRQIRGCVEIEDAGGGMQWGRDRRGGVECLTWTDT